MARYRKTSATVVGSAIANAITGGGTVGFFPKVMYRYQVDGHEYMGDRYTQRLVSSAWRGRSERILRHYPNGSQIEVFYNVNDPQDSFLQKGNGTSVRLMMYLILFISLAVLVGVMAGNGLI